METRRLGRDGPEISVVGYGAWEAGGDAWGPNESDDRVVDAIRVALDCGMTWIDTAEVYGSGRSEELVGRAIRGRAEDAVVFTKVAPREEGEPGSGFRPEEVRKAIRASLTRLGLERVDLYQLHWPTDDVAVEETWGAMAALQDEGLVGCIGLSNFDRGAIERCEAIRHVDSIQNQFSLLWQDDRRELIPWLESNRTTYLAYGPLGYGMLSGAITRETTFHPDDWRSGNGDMGAYDRLFAPDVIGGNVERVERLRAIAERLGTTPATIALRWVVEQGANTAAIAGSRNAEHVRENARAGDLTLDDATLAEVDAIFG